MQGPKRPIERNVSNVIRTSHTDVRCISRFFLYTNVAMSVYLRWGKGRVLIESGCGRPGNDTARVEGLPQQSDSPPNETWGPHVPRPGVRTQFIPGIRHAIVIYKLVPRYLQAVAVDFGVSMTPDPTRSTAALRATSRGMCPYEVTSPWQYTEP